MCWNPDALLSINRYSRTVSISVNTLTTNATSLTCFFDVVGNSNIIAVPIIGINIKFFIFILSLVSLLLHALPLRFTVLSWGRGEWSMPPTLLLHLPSLPLGRLACLRSFLATPSTPRYFCTFALFLLDDWLACALSLWRHPGLHATYAPSLGAPLLFSLETPLCLTLLLHLRSLPRSFCPADPRSFTLLMHLRSLPPERLACLRSFLSDTPSTSRYSCSSSCFSPTPPLSFTLLRHSHSLPPAFLTWDTPFAARYFCTLVLSPLLFLTGALSLYGTLILHSRGSSTFLFSLPPSLTHATPALSFLPPSGIGGECTP